jgi:predicted nucleic acid-binding protein
MYLVDTNIFLEILLAQGKKDLCKNFLDAHGGVLSVSDFSLHSIGVIAFRGNQEDSFDRFLQDMLPHVDIVTLSRAGYRKLAYVKQHFRLDFDDAYQYQVAQEHALGIVTLDSDFKNVRHTIQVLFL